MINLSYYLCYFFCKTNMGSLLITSKLPLVVLEKNFSAFLKSYVQYILCRYVYMYSCIHVFMNTRFSLFQQNNACEAVCLIRRIFVDSA